MKGSRDLLFKFGCPSISRERLKLEASNLARMKTRGTNEQNAKLGQRGVRKGSRGGAALASSFKYTADRRIKNCVNPSITTSRTWSSACLSATSAMCITKSNNMLDDCSELCARHGACVSAVSSRWHERSWVERGAYRKRCAFYGVCCQTDKCSQLSRNGQTRPFNQTAGTSYTLNCRCEWRVFDMMKFCK